LASKGRTHGQESVDRGYQPLVTRPAAAGHSSRRGGFLEAFQHPHVAAWWLRRRPGAPSPFHTAGPEAEQVGARVQLFAPRLLRRHVGHRAHRGAGFVRRSGSIDRVGVSCGDAPSPGSPSADGSPPSPPRGRGLPSVGWSFPKPRALVAGPSNFAKPKSRIFAWPRVVTKILYGLMSW
jgi:hypothetical protein